MNLKDLKEKPYEKDPENGMRQSYGAMIVKIGLGAMFLISAITTNWAEQDPDAPLAPMLLSVVFGLAFLAWGILPWWNAKRRIAAAEARKQAEAAAAEQARLNAPKRCPNCGAATKGDKCEYCGSPLP